ASVLEAARLQVLDPLLRVSQHVLLRAENERAGRARFDARGLASGRDAIGAERAVVRLAVDAREPRGVERAAGDAVAVADAVLAVEVDDAVRVLHDRAGRRARGEAARLRAMHAAVLADQPLEIAALVLVLGETHHGPRMLGEIERVVVDPRARADLVAQVVPFHARDLTRLAADALRRVDQLRDRRGPRAAHLRRLRRRRGAANDVL